MDEQTVVDVLLVSFFRWQVRDMAEKLSSRRRFIQPGGGAVVNIVILVLAKT